MKSEHTLIPSIFLSSRFFYERLANLVQYDHLLATGPAPYVNVKTYYE